MRFARVLGVVCGGILVGGLGSLAGCSSSAEEARGATAETVSSASVALTLHDANGARVGEGSGILVAPRLVLTSAHLVAGKARWTVKTADGKTASGSRGLTYDWMVYGSNKSHPRKNDVAVIYLDQPIDLPMYPTLASTRLAAGSKATRIRGTGAGFEQIATTLDTLRTFPNAYVTEIPQGELLDTGGAVVDERNEIVGLVMGRGLTTGKLYVARTDGLVAWLAPKLACGGAATGVRTYGVPGSSSSSSSSSGSTGGTSGSSSGTSGSYGTPPPGSSGSSGDGTGTGTCNDGGGNCSGDCGSSGNDGVPTGSSSSGSSGASSSGTSGSSGSTGTIPGSSGSSGGTSGGTSGSSGSSTIPGGSSGGGGTGVPGGDGDACTGESDDPELCPPEPDGCSGPTCGGGVPDDSIDYGGCACGSNTDGVIVR